MFSTHNTTRFFTRAAVVALATPFLVATLFLLPTGCQRVHRGRPVALNDAPLIIDEAMQLRDWERSTAYYASGAVVAGATRVTFEPKYDNRYNYVADPLIGVANFALIPFTYFRTPPFTTVVYHGAIVPPTHTAMPEVRVIE
ncbi:MAG TPA: hypothetical protein VGR35_16210 [Tepidisphaeraceae bacterium]|nr:hypothetical protein [Tepidisphaeraceae bacterium]